MKNKHAALKEVRKRPVKVMVFGTFDGLHKGHEYFLKEARKRGDYLVAVVARDRTIEEVKGRMPGENEGERKRNVERTGIPDKVLLGSPGDKHEVVRKEKPDVICLGYDQNSFVAGLEGAMTSAGVRAEIVRIGAYKPEKYKTSLLTTPPEGRRFHEER